MARKQAQNTPPAERDTLPAVPDGGEVTAWGAQLPVDVTSLSPRMVMIMLMHVSWLRWAELAAMLQKQVAGSPQGQGRPAGAGGLVGHQVAMSRNGPYPTGEEIRALAQLEGEERDRLAKLAMQAHDLGLLGDDF